MPPFRSRHAPRVRRRTQPLRYAVWCAVVWGWLGLLTGLPAQAQQEHFNQSWRWIHFTTATGLPSNQVYDLLQTDDAVLWAATSEGVSWYDGYGWQAAPDLPATGVRDWAPHPDGTLLVLMDQGLFLGDTLGFRPIAAPAAAGLSEFIFLDDGTLLGLRATERGLAELLRFSPDLTEATAVATPAPPQLAAGQDALFHTATGRVYLNTRAGLYRYEDGALAPWIGMPPNGAIVAMVRESTTGYGAAYAFWPQQERGLWEWQGAAAPTRHPDEGQVFLQAFDVAPDGEGLAVYQSGEVRLHRDGQWQDLWPVPPPLQHPLFVRYVGEQLWVGTEQGLYRFHRTSDRWSYWQVPGPNRSNMVNAILQTRDGTQWVGTGKGIGRLRAGDEAVWYDTAAGRPLQHITGLAESRDGTLWASSGGFWRGVLRWDGRRWRPARTGTPLDTTFVHRMYEDREGRLWFGVLGPHARTDDFSLYYAQDGRVHAWPEAAALLGRRVYAIEQTGDGALWFGTNLGLSRYHDGTWTHFDQADGLHSSHIFSLASLPDGRVCFAHQHHGRGVGCLAPDGALTYFDPPAGIRTFDVWELAVGPQGSLWAASREGLLRLHRDTWFLFDQQAGLPSLSLWPLQFTGQGLLIGTHGGGLARVSLEGAHKRPLIKPAPAVVEHDEVLLRWQALAPDARLNPADIRTRFRVDEGPWSPWGGQRETRIPGLSYGEHVLEVEAHDLYTAQPARQRMAFVIPPPFYLQPLFALPVGTLAALFLLLLGTHLYRRRLYAADLQRQEASYRTLFNQVADPVFLVSPHSLRLIDHNAAVSAVYGFDEEALRGMTLLDFHPIEEGPRLKEALQAQATPSSLLTGYYHRTAQGRRLPVELHLSRIEHRGAEALLVTAHDVTEQHRVRTEITRAKEQAEELVRLKDTFLANMSHEIRTPLNGILGFAEVLEEELQGEHQDFAEIIGENGQRLLRTLNDVLDLARLEADAFGVAAEPMDLAEMTHQTLQLFEPMAQKKDLQLHYFGPHHLPAYLDPRCVERVLNNLVHNAIKFTQRGDIYVRLQRTDDHLLLSVQDTGIGISEAFLPSLFNEFAQESTGLRRRHEGSGLGLTITKRMVDLMHGTIEVKSTLGEGTTFAVRFPVAVPVPSPNGEDQPVPSRRL